MPQENIKLVKENRSPEEILLDVSRIKKELDTETEQEKRSELEKMLDTYEKELAEAVVEEDIQ